MLPSAITPVRRDAYLLRKMYGVRALSEDSDKKEHGQDEEFEGVGRGNYRGVVDVHLLQHRPGCSAKQRAKQRCEPQLRGYNFWDPVLQGARHPPGSVCKGVRHRWRTGAVRAGCT